MWLLSPGIIIIIIKVIIIILLLWKRSREQSTEDCVSRDQSNSFPPTCIITYWLFSDIPPCPRFLCRCLDCWPDIWLLGWAPLLSRPVIEGECLPP